MEEQDSNHFISQTIDLFVNKTNIAQNKKGTKMYFLVPLSQKAVGYR